MILSVTVPPEPDDRSVVLDRNARAWQRIGEHWYPTAGPEQAQAYGVKWGYLLFDLQPLALLVTEAERADDYGVQPGGDVLLAAGDAAWLNVLVDNARPVADVGPMSWGDAGRAHAKTLLGYGEVVAVEPDPPLTRAEPDPEPA